MLGALVGRDHILLTINGQRLIDQCQSEPNYFRYILILEFINIIIFITYINLKM